MLTIAKVLQHYLPKQETEIFLTEILELSRAQLRAYPERKLTSDETKKLKEWLERFNQGEPLAYIVGHQPFWTLDLKVTEATLIPRPETECLVEWIVKNTPSTMLKVLDLGTGTGAIALSLALERPDLKIDAVDCCEKALKIACENQALYSIDNVRFFQSVWFDHIPEEKKYDVIVSNPPYVRPNDPHLAQLTHEPNNALIADETGLSALKIIISEASQHLNDKGIIVLEHGFDQQDAVCDLLRKVGFNHIVAHQDLSKNPRFVTGIK